MTSHPPIPTERQLRAKNLELEKANKAKDAFLASMSHELRTPLNAIIGFTGTLLMGLPGPLNEAQAHQLRLVETSGQHLLSLINDLLDLAKIESGKVEISPHTIDCRSVLEEVVQSMRPAAEQKGLALHLDLPAAECLVTADRRALGQILVKLVHNAIKLTDVGSIHIGLRPPGDGVPWSATVADTGPGIEPEKHGLALCISHKLAELMGLRIVVESRPGEGSTFGVGPA
jgi:protein-histidine pros-kinase